MSVETLTGSSQGLVTNGAKVYVVALPSEPIDQKVVELNELGRSSGGSAHGYVRGEDVVNNPCSKLMPTMQASMRRNEQRRHCGAGRFHQQSRKPSGRADLKCRHKKRSCDQMQRPVSIIIRASSINVVVKALGLG